MRRTRLVWVVLALVVAAATAACGDDGGDTNASAGGESSDTTAASEENVTLRLGYFPNVTHATGIVGVEKGIFAKNLGSNVKLETKTFNAGPAAVEALLADALDATFIGPNPAINAYAKSKGEAIRIIAGATSGGAALVVKPTITDVSQLKGKKVATPQLGNTQDVAARAYFAEKGLKTNPQGGGDVSIVPQENAQTLDTFKAGDIDGAWVPEPWVARLVQEGKGKVLVDEKTLWPGGKFVTTHLIVKTSFLKEHPETVKKLLQGTVEANDYISDSPADAQKVVNDAIGTITGKKLAEPIITAAWANLEFTNDPVAASLKESAKDAEAVGLLEKVDLSGIYDLKPLNGVLKDLGQSEVSAT